MFTFSNHNTTIFIKYLELEHRKCKAFSTPNLTIKSELNYVKDILLYINKMDINIIMTKLNIKYFESIISSLDKQNITVEWITDHLKKLQLENNTEIETETKTETVQNTKSDENSDMYKKPWNKLNPIHKKLKIKEFINNLTNITDLEKDKLKEELLQLVETKVLYKKEKVNYDENNGKIISLINLQYKNNKYIYLT